jgi:lipoyl(octanoyl) transferase
VITLGRHARPEHVLLSPAELAARGLEVHPVSRGGDVTYHGPGQLVGYPVFRLRPGLVAHMERMAAAIIDVLGGLGLVGAWRRDRPGVWVGDEKICAFGVHVSHRVAIHGFALNVTTPPEAFSPIVPCGLSDAGVTSIAALAGRAPAPAMLAPIVAAAIARAFGLALETSVAEILDVESPVLPVANPNSRSIE